MAIIQTTDQIRYLKRKNLEEEARIIANYYSDIVAQYGIDCVYHKMDMSEFSDFKGVVDRNAVLKRAYGCDTAPDYSVSARTIAFAEVDQDIFNLNKIGYAPNGDITLVFDSRRFACDLAPAAGAYREYRVDPGDVVLELPPYDPSDPGPEWPFEIGLSSAVPYRCGVLSGLMRCVLSGYQPGVSATAQCDPYEHADFFVEFPKNGDLYYSLKYKVSNDDYLETMLFLDYVVDEVPSPSGPRYVLRGRTRGSVLFFDLAQLGKYTEMLHPMVGDIVEIDFPDDNNREKYEITDCFDKQLTQDGVNPLLHKYVWKCKARRYINSHEAGAPGDNEADARLEERRRYETVVQEEVADAVSMYDELEPGSGVPEDHSYGGYDLSCDSILSSQRDVPEPGAVPSPYDYDKQDWSARPGPGRRIEFLPPGMHQEIAEFGSGSRLVTDGFELVFVTAGGDAYAVRPAEGARPAGSAFPSGVRWLKATDSQVVFVSLDGEAAVLANDSAVNGGKLEIALNDMGVPTVDDGPAPNAPGDDFFKFKGTRTVLMATADALYARLASDGRAYRLA